MADSPNNKKRILIVDDEKSIREILSAILVSLGYEVVTASNGNEGLGLFSRSAFSLVITDLYMPEVDGLTFAFSIKETSPGTPVVLITAGPVDDEEGDPVDLVMHKPFSLSDLQKTVQMFLPG
jgi:CheY-like chemotaxis protein